MKKEARTLHSKAVDSLVLGVDQFNRSWDRGRTEAVLIFIDRAFELLLKAIIVHKGGKIRDRQKKKLTIGFDQCLRKCLTDADLKCLSDDEAIALQNLNSLRDAAQHYLIDLSEEQLYIYAQSALSIFRRLSKDAMGLDLRSFVADRVLPICARPPRDFSALLDSEFAEIKKLIEPGARKRLGAKSRLRAMSILEGSLTGEKTQPDDSDLDKLVARINSGEEWRSIFPGVATLNIAPEVDGPGLSLTLTRNKGEAVQIVAEGTPGATVIAVRKVNETSYYSLGFRDLSKKLKVTGPKLLLLINHLRIQEDEEMFKQIKIGNTIHKRYSPKALDNLHRWLQESGLSRCIRCDREVVGRMR